jgi:hypothetical protein
MSTDFANINASGLNSEGSYTPDKLMDRETIQRKVTILSGQNLARGALLGRITASGKYVLSLSASSNGSEVPDAVLLEPCDASGGDKEAIVAIKGRFNGAALILGTAHTLASIDAGLRDKNIFLESAIG